MSKGRQDRIRSAVGRARLVAKPAIVFLRGRAEAEVAAALYGPGAVAVHGGVAEGRRAELLAGLREGRGEVAFATGVWAEKIHVPEVRAIIVERTGTLLERAPAGARGAPGGERAHVFEVREEEDLRASVSDPRVAIEQHLRRFREGDPDRLRQLWPVIEKEAAVSRLLGRFRRSSGEEADAGWWAVQLAMELSRLGHDPAEYGLPALGPRRPIRSYVTRVEIYLLVGLIVWWIVLWLAGCGD